MAVPGGNACQTKFEKMNRGFSIRITDLCIYVGVILRSVPAHLLRHK